MPSSFLPRSEGREGNYQAQDKPVAFAAGMEEEEEEGGRISHSRDKHNTKDTFLASWGTSGDLRGERPEDEAS